MKTEQIRRDGSRRDGVELSLHLSLLLSIAVGGSLAVAACKGEQDAAIESSALMLQRDGGTDAGTSDPVAAAIKHKRHLIGESTVGNPTSGILSTPSNLAKYQKFEHGVIVYTVDLGAHYLSRQIFDRWLALKGKTTRDGKDLYAYLKGPTSDLAAKTGYTEVTLFGGRIIIKTSGTPYTVYGDMESRHGEQWSQLGAPVSDELSANGGWHQNFEHGGIYEQGGPNAFVILKGKIYDKWQSLGGIGGTLGFPIRDCLTATGVQSGYFEHGAIFASDSLPAQEILSSGILQNYISEGGPAGWLGLPTGSGQASPCSYDYVDFQNGVIVDRPDPNDPNAQHSFERFGTLIFHLQEFEGFKDWAGSSDTFGYLDVDTSAGNVVNHQRFPANGNENPVYVDQDWVVAEKASHNFTVDVHLEAWDDEPVGRDWLGTATETYNICNVWGKDIPHLHQGFDLSEDEHVDARFNVKDTRPCKGQNKDWRECYWWRQYNVGTSNLSWDKFASSFSDVDSDESHWVHPLNYLFYSWFYDDIASGGNC